MREPGLRRTAIHMAAAIAGLHLAGFFLLVAVVAPGNFGDASGALTVGVGLTAYTLGLRHALDADHIAAIDATTRKLIGEGRQPLSVGFFFSLGHSTIVFALALLFALGVGALGVQVQDEGSLLHELTGWIGAAVSGMFLYALAAINLVVLVGIGKARGRPRRGEPGEAELERRLEGRGGPMSRLFGRFGRAVTKPWQMYPVGALFGLGFDTATEVALLFLAAGAGGAGLPFYAILCLPLLFAAGIVLLDTLNGSFMNAAYSWAQAKPEHRIAYNLTVTALSILVALAIGTVQLGGLVVQKLGLSSEVWDWLAGLDPLAIGIVVSAAFVLVWLVAAVAWRGRLHAPIV